MPKINVIKILNFKWAEIKHHPDIPSPIWLYLTMPTDSSKELWRGWIDHNASATGARLLFSWHWFHLGEQTGYFIQAPVVSMFDFITLLVESRLEINKHVVHINEYSLIVYFCVFHIPTGPSRPEGSRGESLVKNLKQPTVLRPREGRGFPFCSQSGIAVI